MIPKLDLSQQNYEEIPNLSNNGNIGTLDLSKNNKTKASKKEVKIETILDIAAQEITNQELQLAFINQLAAQNNPF